ncbi:Oidioi.mRNA.OKI2018_I69.chr2.g7110.t2.cds [Oikopleura dioica]|uniref:Oidioi.mRNA.OKI2018_I69.chr2.g7110.t2.cds n=1 Tax=Oikopleura dioica TaxID=34765 RepID=A0ABN7T8N1_OIKDI|nr:Oidioi.mRNA.OKI2018_I69.chr2.g7110.t2.cds [Oikopleura dioica]
MLRKNFPKTFSASSNSFICPDLDKNERCLNRCQSSKNDCINVCDENDYTCSSRCEAEFFDCRYACPCEEGCPVGCVECSNAVCNEREFLFILNYWRANEDVGYLLNLKTEEISYATVNYNSLSIDDSCYAFLGDKHFLLRGSMNPHQILTFESETCSLREHGVLGTSHVDGMYGSCAAYNEIAYLCFDENGVDQRGCQGFDGNDQIRVKQKSTHAHDWSSMAVYDGRMWVVGGCESSGCYNHVEFFDGNSWQLSVPHPDSTIWADSGELSQAQKFSYGVNAGVIVNGYAYIGKDVLDKAKLEPSEFSAYSLGNDPDDTTLWLYYSPMITDISAYAYQLTVKMDQRNELLTELGVEDIGLVAEEVRAVNERT